MRSDRLINLLKIFKLSREKLVNDFTNENIEIFSPMFEYEKDIELMRLSIDKYFTSYVNHHFKISQKFEDINEQFSCIMLTFLRSLDVQVKDTNLPRGKDFFCTLMRKKEKLLEEIISIGCMDSKKYNALIYSYQKDKALFDRKINTLSEGK